MTGDERLARIRRQSALVSFLLFTAVQSSAVQCRVSLACSARSVAVRRARQFPPGRVLQCEQVLRMRRCVDECGLALGCVLLRCAVVQQERVGGVRCGVGAI